VKKKLFILFGILGILITGIAFLGTCDKISSLFMNEEKDEDELDFTDTEDKEEVKSTALKEEKKETSNEIADMYKTEVEPKEEIEHITPPEPPPQKVETPHVNEKKEAPKEVDTFYKFNPPAEKQAPKPAIKAQKEAPKKVVQKAKEKPRRAIKEPKIIAKAPPKETPKKEVKKPTLVEKPKPVEKPVPPPPTPAPVPAPEEEASDLDSLLETIPEEKEEPRAEPKIAPKPDPEPAKEKEEIDLENLGLDDFVEDKGFIEEPQNFIPTLAPEKENLSPQDYDKYNIILSITPKYEGSIFTVELQGTKRFILGNRNPKVTAKIYKLKNPYRTAIDFVNAKFASIPETIEISHIESPIEKITTKYFEEKDKNRTIARVIIHLKRQAIFKKDLKSDSLLKISFR